MSAGIAMRTLTVHLAVTNTTLRLALAYVTEQASHRVTVHPDVADIVVADLAMARACSTPVDVVVVEPLPHPCQEAIDVIMAGRARAAISTDEPESLAAVMATAHRGVVTLPQLLIERANAFPRLPDRLDTILRFVVAGHTNTGIARQLHQSESTVKRDITALLRHFGAVNRQSLARAANAAGYLLACR